MVIGGGQLYTLLMPFVNRIYLTRIQAAFEADTFFTPLSDDWKAVSVEEFEADEKNKYAHSIIVYEKE